LIEKFFCNVFIFIKGLNIVENFDFNVKKQDIGCSMGNKSDKSCPVPPQVHPGYTSIKDSRAKI